MLELLKKYETIVKNVVVQSYEHQLGLFKFVAEIVFIDDSKLFIKDYRFRDGKRKYAYHWQNLQETLLIRWDNAEHWQSITTFPHHKHIGTEGVVTESYNTTLDEILEEINTFF